MYNFAMDTLDPKNLLEKLKLDVVFYSLKYAAKLIVASCVVLKNVEDGSCRYYYAHQNNTLLEKSKLVNTTKDMAKVKSLLSNTDIIEWCTRERANNIWKLHKLANVTLFAALLKEVSMGCKDTVLPDPLSKNHCVMCLTYEKTNRGPYNDNICLFGPIGLHLYGKERLES